MSVTKNPLAYFLEREGAVGKGKAITRAKIAEALDVTIRSVRGLAELARRKGEFVCYSTDSTAGGLYLAATDDERMELIQQIRAECVRRLGQYSALRRSLRDRGQGRLFPENADAVFRRSSP